MTKCKDYIIAGVKLLVGIRKMIVALIFLVTGLSLLLIGFITGTELIETTRDVIVAFMATNLGEHLAEAIAKFGSKKK